MGVHGIGQWFKCKGCGAPIGFLPAGVAGPKRTCAHVKPDHLLGVPNSVPCALYRRLDADELWALHQDDEPIEAPTVLHPSQLPGVYQKGVLKTEGLTVRNQSPAARAPQTVLCGTLPRGMDPEILRLVEEAQAFGLEASREGLRAAIADARGFETPHGMMTVDVDGDIEAHAKIVRTLFDETRRGSSCSPARPMVITDLVRLPPT